MRPPGYLFIPRRLVIAPGPPGPLKTTKNPNFDKIWAPGAPGVAEFFPSTDGAHVQPMGAPGRRALLKARTAAMFFCYRYLLGSICFFLQFGQLRNVAFALMCAWLLIGCVSFVRVPYRFSRSKLQRFQLRCLFQLQLQIEARAPGVLDTRTGEAPRVNRDRYS